MNPIDLDAEDVDLSTFDAIIDVRPQSSTASSIPRAAHVPLDELLDDPAAAIPSVGSRVLIVCDVGMRSRFAATALAEQGYRNVHSLAGGMDAWRRTDRAVQTGSGLTRERAERYDRQVKLDGIGLRGQRALLEATVTVVGAGGLGVPALAYLAAAGVGRIRVVDADVVELSNLHRQPAYRAVDVGSRKVDAISRFLSGLDDTISVEAIATELDADNAVTLLAGSDVVVDATDRFDTRYAISDAAQQLGIPVISGAVQRWEGQVIVLPPGGPCYRCVFPTAPTGQELDCAIVGVAGPVVGTIGSMQATEVIKLLAGPDVAPTGTLTVFDGRSTSTMTVRTARRSGCPGCSAPLDGAGQG